MIERLRAAAKPLYALWMRLAHVLAWVNTRVLLFLVFLLVILPTALVLKALGRDPLRRRFDRAAPSYRVASRSAPRERMERPF
ncbi:MAG: SxtJ family membrane protein [Pseudomonadota bacterium]